MAEKPLRGINFPGLDDTYIIPEPDTTLTESGVPADAKAVGDKLGAIETALDGIIAIQNELIGGDAV